MTSSTPTPSQDPAPESSLFARIAVMERAIADLQDRSYPAWHVKYKDGIAYCTIPLEVGQAMIVKNTGKRVEAETMAGDWSE